MSASAPLVSVLTPVHNGEHYLAACIESVRAQTYTNWEYVIVDNASTDRTRETAERYAARDPRIRVVSNPRLVGVIENHNIAFRQPSAASAYCKRSTPTTCCSRSAWRRWRRWPRPTRRWAS